MSLSDPIGDMIARIKNASVRNYKKVEIPSSKFKVKMCINALLTSLKNVNFPFIFFANKINNSVMSSAKI